MRPNFTKDEQNVPIVISYIAIMDFKSYLKNSAQRIDEELDIILSEVLNEIKSTNPKLIPFALGFISSCKGGKRIRGTLVKLGYELTQGVILRDSYATPQNDIIRIGAAIEILHAAILIHDDIIDQSPTRRGQPTLYKTLGGGHLGESLAIGLGDIGLYLPIKIIADSNFLDQYKTKALSQLSKIIVDTVWGEVLDVELANTDGERSKEDVIKLMFFKTAQYTISGPLILGAILAGADEQLLKQLGKFGENLGIAFQIQDDILGVFGSEQELGKSTSSDIEEGKNTLLIVEAVKNADVGQKQILDRFYGRGKISKKEMEDVKNIFRETGAFDNCQKEALRYVTLAKKVIPDITKDENLSTLLDQMADYLLERRR